MLPCGKCTYRDYKSTFTLLHCMYWAKLLLVDAFVLRNDLALIKIRH